VILQDRIVDTLVKSNDLRVIDVLVERVLYLGGKAIHGLMTIGSPAVDALIQLYQSHPEEWVRDSSLWALVQIGDKSAIESLLNVWNGADEVNKRKIQSAIDKLSKIAE
jgi:HEAT repeat protein